MRLGQRAIRFIGRNLFEAAEGLSGKKPSPEQKQLINDLLDKIYRLQEDPAFQADLDSRIAAFMGWLRAYPELEVSASK